jgi:hypothetical protein
MTTDTFTNDATQMTTKALVAPHPGGGWVARHPAHPHLAGYGSTPGDALGDLREELRLKEAARPPAIAPARPVVDHDAIRAAAEAERARLIAESRAREERRAARRAVATGYTADGAHILGAQLAAAHDAGSSARAEEEKRRSECGPLHNQFPSGAPMEGCLRCKNRALEAKRAEVERQAAARLRDWNGRPRTRGGILKSLGLTAADVRKYGQRETQREPTILERLGVSADDVAKYGGSR